MDILVLVNFAKEQEEGKGEQMKLEHFAEQYGLNTRAVNGLYDLKKRADRGEFPHDSDPRVRRYFDNNIEKALIIAVKAEMKRE